LSFSRRSPEGTWRNELPTRDADFDLAGRRSPSDVFIGPSGRSLRSSVERGRDGATNWSRLQVV
jgi:hypothetical protein